MVGGVGIVGFCLGSVFCYEFFEVVLNFLEFFFVKEGRGRWVLGMG